METVAEKKNAKFLQLDITLHSYKFFFFKKAQSATLPCPALPSVGGGAMQVRAAAPRLLGLLCTPAPERDSGRVGWAGARAREGVAGRVPGADQNP